MKSNRFIIVFSGFNQRAVISFIRTLCKNNVAYAIVAVSHEDTIFKTDYNNKVVAIRDSLALNLDDIINSIQKVKNKYTADKYLIAPSTEALNRFLLKERSVLENLGCIIPLVDEEVYVTISDKYSFGQVCKSHDILIPNEFNVFDEISLPCVAKPKSSQLANAMKSQAPVILQTKSDLLNFERKYNHNQFYFQEFVRGKSFYLLYYCARNRKVFKYSQENVMQQPEGKSIVAAISSDFHHSEEAIKYTDLFRRLNYRGFVMVEVRQDGDKNYMIEANPRFWGPSQLFVDAGVNLFEAFLQDYGVLKKKPIFKERKKTTKYFWFGGILETYFKKQTLSFFSYSQDKLCDDLPDWIGNDIYRRKDTRSIFEYELNG